MSKKNSFELSFLNERVGQSPPTLNFVRPEIADVQISTKEVPFSIEKRPAHTSIQE